MCAYKTVITISNEIKHTIGLVKFYFQNIEQEIHSSQIWTHKCIKMKMKKNIIVKQILYAIFFQSYLIRFDVAIKINWLHLNVWHYFKSQQNSSSKCLFLTETTVLINRDPPPQKKTAK